MIQRLASWNAFSNSSPVEGIEAAIRQLAKGNLKISIYVLGDEFTGDSVEGVLERRELHERARRRPGPAACASTPSASRRSSRQGEYPETTTVRFAILMRALCERNGGAFVGLNSLEP